MFSKTRVTENRPQQGSAPVENIEPSPAPAAAERTPETAAAAAAPRGRSTPSVLSSDLTVTGNIRTQGDIQIEGNVEGDVRAHQLTVGESATIKGEIVGDDVIVHGRVIGRVRGLKVRLSATARVEGDIIHKTIAIESGAHFEGSVQRQEDPLANGGTKKLAPPNAG
ncbi:polymer-forming cytoskeletal protein [Paracoccus sp. 11-3]|uniref:Polymer-forming cytoskeletal protein n=1 Tax=Paracoccus amoyensis TaxID=2760093 RepID=A0A926JDK7_9RHOB|nr:polymer-forming cytoskeletal protein [Paracoccus amoyensis]MBC9248245.1 polymer-forming cytoskeletal protein [Paracoccus amoyensis]